MEQIEHNIEELNKVVNRHMLTDIEVQLSNIIIKQKKIIDEQEEAINKCLELFNDHFYSHNEEIFTILEKYKKGSEDDIQSREPR